MNEGTGEQTLSATGDITFLRQAADCPNEFPFVTNVKKWAKTKKAVTKSFQDRLKEILPALEKAANCGQYQCEDGDCEFDYMIDDDTPRKIFQKTGKGKKRRRWVVQTDVYFGCFCPDHADDPENDPGNGNF